MKSMRRMLLAVTVAAFTVGCGSDSTGPGGDEGLSGSMSFTYSGALSGTFSANGKFTGNLESSLNAGSLTIGFRHPENGLFGVNGYDITSGTRGNMAVMVFEGTEKGRYTPGVPSECEPRCATVMLYFNLDMGGGAQTPGSETRTFYFETGELNVTELDSKVVKGTFSGTAVEFLGTAELTITNGTFSAPIIPAFPGAGGIN